MNKIEPEISQFHAVFRKLSKSDVGAPRGLAPPPTGNSRSAQKEANGNI